MVALRILVPTIPVRAGAAQQRCFRGEMADAVDSKSTPERGASSILAGSTWIDIVAQVVAQQVFTLRAGSSSLPGVTNLTF